MAQAVTVAITVEANPEYRPGKPGSRDAITVEAFAALPKRPKNFRRGTEADTANGIAGYIVRKPTRRAVRIIGSGVVAPTHGGTGRAISGATISAEQAASLAGLTPEETALFVARFPADGTDAPKPENPDAVAVAFRKVNRALSSGTLSWSVSASEAETLS